MSQIFISYAREDSAEARNLYEELVASGYRVWLDSEELLPGQRWKDEISRAIETSAAFLALMSTHSINKRGYVQKELRVALEVLDTVPANQLYFIPVRLEDVRPVDRQLQDLNWVDLFSDRADALERILRALGTIPELGSRRGTGASRSRPEAAEEPKGPSLSMADAFRGLIERIPRDHSKLNTEQAFYVTFRTEAPGVILPEKVKEQYPDRTTLVFQHQYRDLRPGRSSFSVTLWFSGEAERVTVPYDAIELFQEPSTGLVLGSRGAGALAASDSE